VLAALPGPAQGAACSRIVTAHVVALDQVISLNRMGSQIPGGMMYALARDVFPAGTPVDQQTDANSCRWKPDQCKPGQVELRHDRRPRPLVLRANEGDCLQIVFTNLLGPQECFDISGKKVDCSATDVAIKQPSTPWASLHVQGMPWVNGPQDDGSFVSSLGTKPPQASSLAASAQATGASRTYELFAEHEGSYLLYSTADDWTSNPAVAAGTAPVTADGGALAAGLFGAVNIQPSGFDVSKRFPAEWYRSQVTEQDLCLASQGHSSSGGRCQWADSRQLPVLDYQARYPAGHPYAGLPILNMLCTAATPGVCDANELVSADLTAVITGPKAGRFPDFPIALQPPDLRPIYSSPDRLQPYREFTIIYHESFQVAQAFQSIFSTSPGGQVLQVAQDNFGINYGMGALAPELLSNRLGVGPAAKCTDCKYEEFFLSSWALGDPAMPVDEPASSCLDTTTNQPKPGCHATAALYPDDPSNVYHSYISDHTKFRILHAGPDLHHLHHQHAHQWLGTPNSPNGDYLDSQSIGPGSSFTLEMVYNGSGNLNQTVGDSIFHCHFYPHFGSGMWSMWRVHDVLERGTELEPCGGALCPRQGARALPDGEIARGTPIPAVVPMPTLPLAPVPARVELQSFCSNDLTKTCSADGDCGGGNTCQQSYCVVQTDAVTGQEGACVSSIQASQTSWEEEKKFRNPGYPFFIPGIAGSRAPHPPMDFAYACSTSGKVCTPGTPAGLGTPESCDAGETCDEINGGLPRHLVARGGSVTYPNPAGGNYQPTFDLTPTDFSKVIATATAVRLPEEGTWVEKVAMGTHSQRFHDSQLPDGTKTGVCSDNGAPCSGPGLLQKQQCADPPRATCGATGICSDNRAFCSGNTLAGKQLCDNPVQATCDPYNRINFVLNGLPPEHGAPYADPCIQFQREGGAPQNMLSRRFLAADIQLDAIFNKSGWHFPQERILSLWGDAQDLIDRKKPPEPFFIRTNSEDCMEYVYANLVPNVYELDDFQVRTPTDILGQHIHLVKFDVTSSDGSSNGWNYEDGTFAPNEVTERIHALNHGGGLLPPPGSATTTPDKDLTPTFIKFFGPGPGAQPDNPESGAWMGAQATIQRWYADPLFNNQGFCSTNLDVACSLDEMKFGIAKCPRLGRCIPSAGVCSDNQARCTDDDRSRCGKPALAECNSIYDRTIRTVFTHDHYGPSTHQQAGLYAGVIVEPKGSIWRDNQTGDQFGGYRPSVGANDEGRTALSGYEGRRVRDGGPTSWQAVIETANKNDSYREFLLQVQDSTLTYQAFAVAGNPFDKERKGVCTSPENKDQPCGFCSYNGVCVDASTGNPTQEPPQQCTLAPPAMLNQNKPVTSTGCTTGVCRLHRDFLTACTPEDLSACKAGVLTPAPTPPLNPTYLIAAAAPAPASCNFVTGVPSTSWAAGNPISSSNVEAITFYGGTNNFSFNYRNEPLYARTTNPATGAVLTGNTGDLAYAYSSDPGLKRPNPRGQVCSNNLATACTADAGCPAATAGSCAWAGFCSDNSALCTSANVTLCSDSTKATCKGACDPQTQASCDTSFPYPELPLIPGVPVEPGDPFTPLLRAYAGDDIQIRPLIGAHINPHNYTMNGLKWLLEPSFVDSGWRNSEVMGISEHFELLTQVAKPFSPAASGQKPWEDYLYQPGFAIIEQASGNWGLLRAYDTKQNEQNPLYALPQNQPPANAPGSRAVCPKGAPPQSYEVMAVNADLVYNQSSPLGLKNADGIVFAKKGDPNLDCTVTNGVETCSYKEGVTPQPLVLRAAAGDCIEVTLTNAIDATKLAAGTSSTQTNAKSNTSAEVGLHPQLLTYDMRASDGTNAGFNPVQTAAPGKSVHYEWYAGSIDTSKSPAVYIPIELGASNLLPPDPINHAINGLFAGLIIEPKGATWKEGNPLSGSTASTEAVVTVHKPGGKTEQFREFVMFTQDGLPKALSADVVNYRTELLNTGGTVRFCDSKCADTADFSCLYTAADAWCNYSGSSCEPCTDYYTTSKIPFPETPTFEACAGEQVRFRMLHPGGTNTDQVIEIYGHNFSEAPYMTPYANLAEARRNCKAPITHTNLYASQVQGTENLCGSIDFLRAGSSLTREGLWNASLNEWRGSRMGHGPGNHFDALIGQAGGPFKVPGDYLYRSFPAFHFNFGIWGIFRVRNPNDKDVAKQCLAPSPGPASKEFNLKGLPTSPEITGILPTATGTLDER